MEKINLPAYLKNNSYPGRGIILGCSPDGKQAAAAYFIMGRSENSRNRIFVGDGAGLRTQAYDPSKMEDPSLIIYAPVYQFADFLIVANGDQSDTIRLALLRGKSLPEALAERTFEPDAPHYTPRISGVMHFRELQDAEDVEATGVTEDPGADRVPPFWYELSILKAKKDHRTGNRPDADEPAAERLFWNYPSPAPGTGHFISTYQSDGTPLPSFAGDPYEVEIPPTAEEFTELLWESLHPENKVSLFVRYLDLRERTIQTEIRNARNGD